MFKLDDPAERRAFDWMQRFHGPDANQRLLDVARARAPEGQPDVIMLSECAPAPDEQEPSWLVIRFELAEIRVTWRTFGMLDPACAAFSAAVNTPPHLTARAAAAPTMSAQHGSDGTTAPPDAQDAPARTMEREHRSAETVPAEVSHG